MGIIPKIYEDNNIKLSMAGSGDPWSYFKPSSKLTLRALFDGYSLNEIQEIFEISEKELIEKISLLVDASLVKVKDGKYIPDFLIVNEEETKKTYEQSKELGRILADEIKENWDEIENDYSKLSISKSYSLNELSFALVGSKIIDIALLEVLAKDRTLLQPAPKRPSPKRPDAQYYFFMIDGKYKHLGKYGEESMELPKKNWTFITFGQGIINEKSNEPRNNIEKKCDEIRKKGEIVEPEEFAKLLDSPMLSMEDSLNWKHTSLKIAERLLVRIKESKQKILDYFKSLKASSYASNSLGEFSCWYFHIVYSWIIDFLIEEKIIPMPHEKFCKLIIYVNEAQGLTTK